MKTKCQTIRLAAALAAVLAVSALGSDRATAQFIVTRIIDATGDGTNSLSVPNGIAVDAAGNAYVSGTGTNNVFKIAAPPVPPAPPIPTLSDFGIVVLLLLTAVTGVIVIRTAREPGGAGDLS